MSPILMVKHAAILGRIASAIGGGLRTAAKVPQGQPFASSFGAGAKHLTRLAFNPHLGRYGNIGKRAVQGTALFGAATGGLAVQDSIRAGAVETLNTLPGDLPRARPLRNFLMDLHDSPLWTSAKTAITGLPSAIPGEQRNLLQSASTLTAKQLLHPPPPQATPFTALKTLLRPAQPILDNSWYAILNRIMPRPAPRDYLNVRNATFETAKRLHQPLP